MASSGKRKTTGLKLAREAKLRERRATKVSRRNARKQAAADGPLPSDAEIAEGDGEALDIDGEAVQVGEPALDAELDPGVVSPLADA
jgi:hypothetical protein